MGHRTAKTASMEALGALRWNWDEAYDITFTGGRWRAWRRDSLGGALEADDPDALRQEILSDYSFRPVPRDSTGRHPVGPSEGTVYSVDAAPNTGHPGDPARARHYPMEGHCAGCGLIIRLETYDPDGGRDWQHTGRRPGED